MIESVAVVSPGDRVDEITKPLESTSVAYDVNPGSLRGYDVVLCDTPDRDLLKSVVAGRVLRTPVVFRMRGDPFWGMDEWIDSRFKLWVLERITLPNIDGCIAVTDRHAEMFEGRTGVPSAAVPLSVDVDNWPDTRHTDGEIRAVTLTNAIYWPKIDPTVNAIETVEAVLSDVGGEWRIGSWSEGYSNCIREACRGCDHVTFCGDMDAYDALEWANVMIHYSGMDAFPNAVLEGMASGVPVVTNDHEEFSRSDAPITVTNDHDGLAAALERLTLPQERILGGGKGLHYVRQEHSRDVVGEEFADALERLVVENPA